VIAKLLNSLERVMVDKANDEIEIKAKLSIEHVMPQAWRTYSAAVDEALRSMHLRVLKSPARVPQANAFCERLIGTARRECLDHLIPLHERHLRQIPAGYLTTIEVARTRVSVLGFRSRQG
jgi:transposase InsO family protein